MADGGEVVVRAPIGAATFSSSVDRLVIDNQGAPATYEVQIPRAAPRVEIRVNGVRIFLKDGPRIIGPAMTDARGHYRLSLSTDGP